MSFLSIGGLLIALLVVAPIAAHLLRRRQAEEQLFPAARLVPPTPPTARKRSLLEDRALFSVRALAVLGLAILGATPFVRCSRLSLTRSNGASVALAIVLDDSLSMRAKLPGGASRFEKALTGARELAQGLASGDAVAIVLAGAPARVALGSTTNLAAVTAALDAVEPSDRGTDLEGAVQLARGLVHGLAQRDKRVVVLSDLADGAEGAPPIQGDGEIALWVPLPELAASGQDCAVTRADRTGNKVWARVVCSGREGAGAAPTAAADAASAAPTAAAGAASAAPAAAPATARAIEIRAGGKVLVTAPLRSTARSEEVSLTLPDGAPELLRAALTGSDAIAEDDEAPVIAAGGALPIAVVVDATATRVATGGAPPIEQALAALQLDAQIHPLPSVPEHEAELGAFAALIIDDAPGFTPEVRRELAAWVARGGVVLLTLGPRAAAAPLGAGFEPLVPGVVRWGPVTLAPQAAASAAGSLGVAATSTAGSLGVDPASASALGGSAPGLANLNPHGRTTLDVAATEGADVLARWKDGAPFLLRRSLGRGAVLSLTLPLSTDESDLALRPAFLSLLESFVSTARARGGARRIDVGQAWTFDGYSNVKVRRLPLDGTGAARVVPVIEQDRRLRADAPLAGLYELTLDGEATTRVAAVPDREIDFRPREVRDEAHAAAMGGVASALDASPYVALALLGLLAVELALRIRGQRESAIEA
jgi:von Willebrand factor type A domain/Aerotolerance regulator N-terminal